MSVFQPKFTDKKTGKRIKSRVWWCEFTFAGKRYRSSTKQTRKTLALEFEKGERLKIDRAYAGLPTEAPAQRNQDCLRGSQGVPEGRMVKILVGPSKRAMPDPQGSMMDPYDARSI
jgi:hypothetical protein